MPNELDTALNQLVLTAPSLRDRLARAFPNICPGLVDDAVAVALAWAWGRMTSEPPSDLADLERQLFTVAWRQLRGEWRKTRFKHHASLDQCTLETGVDPERDAQARQTLNRIQDLIPRAARQFGRKQPSTMARALTARFQSDTPDTEVAAEFGVSRPALNRARRWVLARVEDSA